MRECLNCHALYDDAVRVCPADGIALAPADPLLGATIEGKYRIEGLLGRGGMGAVYRARQLALERDVAVKVLRGDFLTRPKRRERFKREAVAIARLKHPHIVSVYDFAVSEEVGAYLVLEHVVGRALDAELRQRGRIPVSAALDLMRQVASAAQAAHEAGVVHRDLKPGNVLLDATGKPWLIDFGVARIARLGDPAYSKGVIIGTPHYMPPEQALGDMEAVDARSDVYALGSLLYEMLSGKSPFAGLSTEAVVSILPLRGPEPIERVAPDLPVGLVRIVQRAMDRDPASRYRDAGGLAEDLDRYVCGGNDG